MFVENSDAMPLLQVSIILLFVQLEHSVQRKVFKQNTNVWTALVESSAIKPAWQQQQDLANLDITVHLVQQAMKSYPALQVATVDWAPSILRCVLLEHIQMGVNCRKLRIVLTADQDITAMMKDLLLPRHSVMQGIIVPRVRMSAIHSPVLLESTVLKEVRNLSIVLQGHLLRAHNHLCVLSVLKASIVCRDLSFQVCTVK